jgi:CheY-like chemotaxis protein
MSMNFGSESGDPALDAIHATAPQTILLAEDEELLRKLFSRTLRAAGYRVLEADCSDTAFEAARGNPKIDVLLSDLHLRGVGGISLFQELLRSDPLIKAVFISGSTRDCRSRFPVTWRFSKSHSTMTPWSQLYAECCSTDLRNVEARRRAYGCEYYCPSGSCVWSEPLLECSRIVPQQ